MAEAVHYIVTLFLLPQVEKGCPYEKLPFLASSAAKWGYVAKSAGQWNMNQSVMFLFPELF